MSEERGAARGLALGRVMVGSAVVLARQRRAVLHALTLPAVALLAFELFEAAQPEAAASLTVGFGLLMVPLQVLLAVNVHRLVLLGEGTMPAFGAGGWGLREWRYFGWLWLQGFGAGIAFLAFAPLAAVHPIGWAVAAAVGAFVAGRIALMLPGIAIDRPIGFDEAWRRGHGQSVRLAVLVAGVPLTAVLVLLPLQLSQFLAVRLFGVALSLLLYCWYTGALALAWRALAHAHGDAEAVVAPGAATVAIAPDALRGVLSIDVEGRPEQDGLGAAATGEGLRAYRGRLRGVVVELGEAFAGSDRADWDGLAALLERLAVVQVHGANALRVALVGPAAWAPGVEQLRTHFAVAEARWFPPLRRARATVWASGEDGA